MDRLDDLDCMEAIAIIGMAGRFPQAKTLEDFWQNLRDGVEAITVFSEQELAEAGIDKTLLDHSHYVKAKPVLDDIEQFDAAFFDYPPREAEIIDPQQRFFLECAWEALENAGYDSQQYPGSISLYGGVSVNSYFLFNLYGNSRLADLVGFDQIRHSNRIDNLAPRVAYKLNFNGAAITVQTACSTSLVATHLACQSLLDRECDLALAGGVSISAQQTAGYLYQEGGILSPDGHCRAFDAKAQGTIVGNGIGLVVLKRFADAIADRDCIHAIIRGSAINNDGSQKVGYTAPSVEGQARAIAEALAIADVEPEEISYVETHGTGTMLGDPVELAALTKAFRLKTDQRGFCGIGSVKTNIGHLDTAAGIAGLIKTVLSLKHRQIPPSLHFTQANPQIDFANSPFYVNHQLKPWETNGQPRRAGVSSFGIGGTNAHLILEEAPSLENFYADPPGDTKATRPWQLLLLSAKTTTALETATSNLQHYLQQTADSDLNLADVAYTLQVGRRAFEHRRFILCQHREDALVGLDDLSSQTVFTGKAERSNRSLVWMFPGQGAQYVRMGYELYQHEALFREYVDRCCELLQPHLNLDLRTILYPSEHPEIAAQQLTQTAIAQPALFVIEYALAQLWLSWGIRPQAMIGHSIGEYVAATLAGVFELETALELVAIRGQLMQSMPVGQMLSVALAASELQPFLSDDLALAVSNAPQLSVVAGPSAAIEELHQQLADRDIACRLLHTSHAFHSPMMAPILEPFLETMRGVSLNPPQIPFISNVTGTWITAEDATNPHYWAQHLRQTVRFSDGIAELGKEPEQIFLEIGPGRTLCSLTKQQLTAFDSSQILTSLRHPQESHSDVAFLLKTLGQLWLQGTAIDWSGYYQRESRRRVPLPTYPFERQRYWIEPSNNPAPLMTPPTVSQLTKKPNIADWFYVPVWQQSIIPNVGQPDMSLPNQSCWLIFADEFAIATLLKERLQQQEQDVVMVHRGGQFAQVSDKLYTLNPQRSQDYQALLTTLERLHQRPQIVAHLWGVNASEEFDSIQQWGFESLLYLAQALGEQGSVEKRQLLVVTDQLQNVTGNEVIRPEKATVLGPCRVIPHEYPNLTCRSIDITIPETRNQEQHLIDRLLAEVTLPAADSTIAYRGSHRWVQAFERLTLPEAPTETLPLRKNGVYLITGGLGGLGLTIAESLAQTVQAKLILTGRSRLPAPEKRSQWLVTHDEQDATSRKIQQIQILEKLGAEVLVSDADVANLEQMQALKAQIRERFGKVDGIIHAAGIAGGGLIQLKTLDAAHSVLAPKVQGTLVLDAVFQDTALDFLVLFSALTSILGPIGQVDYCAANAFLDSFTQRQSSNYPTVCLNWSAWQQVGMAVNTAVPEELQAERQAYLQEAIKPTEGIDAFFRVLHSGLSQVIVSPRDLPAQIQQHQTPLNLAESLEQAQRSRTIHERPNISTPYRAPQTELEKSLAQIWQQLLGLEQIGIDDNFFELGGHSLLLTQLLNKLHKTFHTNIAMGDLFENPTIADLSQRLEQLASQQLANSQSQSLEERLLEAFPHQRVEVISTYLKTKIAQALKIEPAQIPNDGNLEQFDLTAIAAGLIWEIKQELRLPIYPHEIIRRPSLTSLAEFIVKAREQRANVKPILLTLGSSPQQRKVEQELSISPGPMLESTSKNDSVVFLLSSPRSGSTLLRIMLANHPDLFCPPELALLTRNKLKQESERNGHSGFAWSFQGLQAALIELLEIDTKESQAIINDWVEQGLSAQTVYQTLQTKAGQRLLVDKTPTYALSWAALMRAESWFENAKYIHLIRHPYAAIASYTRHRLYANLPFEQDGLDSNWLSEQVWLRGNRNLQQFREQVGPERSHIIYYEQLVKEPETVMKQLCEFLEIPFLETLLHPYEGQHAIGGLGDPDILQHDGIEPQLADVWKTIQLPRSLSEETRNLATQLNYELPTQADTLTSEVSRFVALGHWRNETELRTNVERLSDREVKSLLEVMLTQTDQELIAR